MLLAIKFRGFIKCKLFCSAILILQFYIRQILKVGVQNHPNTSYDFDASNKEMWVLKRAIYFCCHLIVRIRLDWRNVQNKSHAKINGFTVLSIWLSKIYKNYNIYSTTPWFALLIFHSNPAFWLAKSPSLIFTQRSKSWFCTV